MDAAESGWGSGSTGRPSAQPGGCCSPCGGAAVDLGREYRAEEGNRCYQWGWRDMAPAGLEEDSCTGCSTAQMAMGMRSDLDSSPAVATGLLAVAGHSTSKESSARNRVDCFATLR